MLQQATLLIAWSRVLLEKLTGSQLVKKFPAFYGTRKFITACTSPRHLSLSWARSIQNVPFPLLRSYQCISPGPTHMHPLHNKASFYGDELLAPRPTPKLEYHPLLAVLDCLFNIFPAALHIGGRSSIRNLRKRHAVMTGTHTTGNQWIMSGRMGKIICRDNRWYEVKSDSLNKTGNVSGSWRVRVTIVATETQHCFPSVWLLTYMQLSTI